ncbi:MAG: hypothetical protein EBY83_04495, partial [Verrucomicrobia bacterium]|nr:hypothetical protein [Verrucomicrobiota bacterium]
MRKLPLFIVLAWGLSGGLPCRASSLQSQVESETTRREQLLQPLQEAYDKSRKLVADGNGNQACEELEKAYQAVPEALRETPLAHQVQKTLSKLQATLGESASQLNHWPEARKRALASLRYDPTNEKALEQLRKSDEVLRRGTVGGEAVNPALTTRFFDRLNGVRTGLEQAQELRETGQLEKSEQAYEDVLKNDPFNEVATDGIKKIYQERALAADRAQALSATTMKREVMEAWNNIYPKTSLASGGVEVAGAMTASPSYNLEKKLQGTVIPTIDFSGADLETIRRALISLSRQYDPEVSKAGVNFVVSSDITEVQPVTLRLRQTSLAEVVRYISQIAGVKARITDIGVTFGPLVEKRPDLIPRNFTVSPSFFKGEDAAADSTATVRGGGGATSLGTETSPGLSEQKKLVALGVSFPEGAYAVYNKNTSQLKVVNNAEMLDLIGQLISAAEEETLLIQVGIRLVEINQL